VGFRIGVDVGGTFTDFLVAADAGKARIYKTSTTGANPAEGFFRGLEKAAADNSMKLPEFLAQVGTIVHGTTITTNTVLTSTGATTGFVTTHGFRDVLNMRRGLKDRQFEKYAPPPPLVPRHLIRTVKERVTVDGTVMTPLDEDDVRAAAAYFRQQNVEAVAVSYLWSFRNPAHEERTREILQQELPGIYVSISTEILPQIRVYERHSTTVLNAYVGPVLTNYLASLEQELAEQGFAGTLLIMQSNGGVMSPQVAQRFASNTLLSGPAGAPQAGIFYGSGNHFSDLITVDMGGTSFDIALIKNATPIVTQDGSIGEHRLASPILDIHTIGAGGGSIASVDGGGLLAVGPASAGAQPGPACYGRGGELPTVTDADLVLGYLDVESFEGGELEVDFGAAQAAIEQHVAKPLNMDLVAAAKGIYDFVNANMAAALSVVSVQRGYDPREFVLIVAGGAGPIHAVPIARELEIPLILVPRESSVFCAAGMLISDLQHDYVRTHAHDIDQVDRKEVDRLYREMSEAANQTLVEEGISSDRVDIRFSADLHYIGQFHEVEVPVSAALSMSVKDLDAVVEAFHQRHDTLYGYAMRGTPVELINLRVTARGITEKPDLMHRAAAHEPLEKVLLKRRPVCFDGEFVDTPVYDGLRLHAGDRITGPAIIAQPTTTIVVPPDFELSCDDFDNYLIYPQDQDLAELRARLSRGFESCQQR
jgi:N-methylhydantoinase A